MKTMIAAAVTAASVGAMAAHADVTQYVRASAGIASLDDSDNSGEFTTAATLLPAGAEVTDGTSVGWTTEFDNGTFLSAAYGVGLANGLRFEGELSFTNNDVDTHTGVTVGGGAVGALDAANLVPGVDEALGVSIGDLVADGQGSVETMGLAGNVYYDFAFTDTPFSAFVGAGLGFAQVDVDYSPSSTVIVDDDETVLFYQIMVGGEYAITEKTALYAGYRFRSSEDVETEVSLFPATLDVETQANIFEAGVRFSF